jgi:hypothetical protein
MENNFFFGFSVVSTADDISKQILTKGKDKPFGSGSNKLPKDIPLAYVAVFSF